MKNSKPASKAALKAQIMHNIPLYLMFLPGAIYLLHAVSGPLGEGMWVGPPADAGTAFGTEFRTLRQHRAACGAELVFICHAGPYVART